LHGKNGGGRNKTRTGLADKQLLGIPWRVAFALRNDGWYLRQDIVWHKPNPMPESVTDRCTKAHEYLFLLTKSERYCFDAEAIREPCSEDMQRRAARGHTRGARGRVDASRQDADTLRGEQAKIIDTSNGRNKRSVWTVPTHPYKGAHFATFPPALIEPCILAGSRPGDVVLDPFGGAGTTALVSLQHGRDSVYIDLNPEYERIARARLAGAFPDAS
jgi:DNA modification methylase